MHPCEEGERESCGRDGEWIDERKNVKEELRETESQESSNFQEVFHLHTTSLPHESSYTNTHTHTVAKRERKQRDREGPRERG